MSSVDKEKETITEYSQTGINKQSQMTMMNCVNCSRYTRIEWSCENELILAEWCDIAQCYKWLYMKAHNSYSLQNAWFTIPAIILSTITGTASFAQNSFTPEQQIYTPMIIGAINITVGILTTIQQFLKISELKETHRSSQIAWDKFGRNLRIELAKSPSERMEAGHFIKLARREYDHLMETSPPIPPYIVKLFNTTFKGTENSEKRAIYDKLKKPDICNSIVTTADKRHPWYLDPHKFASDIDMELNAGIGVISDRDLKAKLRSEKREQDANRYKMNIRIEDYINEFFTMYGRSPNKIEIMDHFRGCDHPELLREFVNKYELDVMV